MNRRRTAWRGFVALVTLSLAVTTSERPVNAVVEDWDHPLMTSQGIDFGDGSWVWGAPALPRADLAEVEICTELSGDNVTFDRIRCKRYEFNN